MQSYAIGNQINVEFDILEDESMVTIATKAPILWRDKTENSDLAQVSLSFEELDDQCLALIVRNLSYLRPEYCLAPNAQHK